MKVIIVLIAASLFTSMPVLAEIYKCTDASGKVHYGDKPCKGESSIFTPRSGPKVDAHAEGRMEKTNRLLRAYKEEDMQERQQAADLKAEKEERMRNCHNARNRYRQVTEVGRIYRIDNSGKRVDYTDQERAGITAKEATEVERWCG